MPPETDRIEQEIEKTNKILTEVLRMVNSHESYISDGKKWRNTVVGVVLTMIIQCLGGLYLAGQLTEKLSNTTKLAERIQERQDKYESEIRGFIREGRVYFRDNPNK